MIVGTPESQWKAQYLIFEKVGEENFNARAPNRPVEEVRLTAEILVPSSAVGRIIGKSGNTVKEMRKETRAFIKLPDQSNSAQSSETPVHIIGAFYPVQVSSNRPCLI